MHIAAMKPESLDINDLSDEAIDKVRGELVPNLPSEFNIEIV